MTTLKKETLKIDATGVYYRDLNTTLRQAAIDGIERVELRNLYGQRYIATDLERPLDIHIYGTPGNDLGAFMNGSHITVYGNAQDGCGNTMDDGVIVVHGHAGDITGLSARGGKIFVRDDVGYRAGIHMKEYEDKIPALVIGGTGQDFLGEYMAGGVIIMLGMTLPGERKHKAKFIGTGMHGGAIYIRGTYDEYQLGKEVGIAEAGKEDLEVIRGYVEEFADYFDFDAELLMKDGFTKLYPRFLRPYGRLYAY